jgi:MFS family permease
MLLAFTRAPAGMLALVGLLGAGQAIAGATWQAMVPALVGLERVGEAMGLLQAGFTSAGIAAPALAGLLSGTFGTQVPLLLDAVSFLALAVAAGALRTRRVPVVDAGAGVRSADGLRFLRQDPVVAPLVLNLGVFVLLGLMVNVVEVFLVRDTLHSSATWYGLLAAVWALGAVAGSLLGGRQPGQSARVTATCLSAAVLSVSLLCFSAAPDVWFLVPVSLLGGAANGVVNVCVGAVIIMRAPEHLRGRVAAAVAALVSAASVLSLLLGGLLATVINARQVFLVAGVAALVSTVVTGPAAVRAARTSAPVPAGL